MGFDLFLKIKKNMIYKRKTCYLLYSKKLVKYLNILLKYNIIKSFYYITYKGKIYYKVYFNEYKTQLILKKLIIFSKNKAVILKSQKLIKNTLKNGLYIISTSKGIISNYECSVLKLGGIIFCKIIF